MFYLSIDQHSNQLTVNSRNESGDVTLRRQVSTKPPLVEAFFERYAKDCGADGFVAIVEVCGFNHWLLALLKRVGCREIVLVQPEERKKQKTDRRDAEQLGEVLWVNRHRLLSGKRVQNVCRVLPPTPEEAYDRQITAMRKRLVRRRTQLLSKVWRMLHKHNLQHSRPAKGIQTKSVGRWLKELSLPENDRFELDLLLEEWSLLDKQIDQVEERIKVRQEQNPKAKIVATIPGMSSYGSLALASRLSAIERFERPASLANFVGLAPGCRNSGNTNDRLGAITKRGSSMVRFILAQAVLHVLKRDPWMRQWYRAVKNRRGSKVARVAVMRRLMTILWNMLKHEMPYVTGGPEAYRKAYELAKSITALESTHADSIQRQPGPQRALQKGPPLSSSPSLGPVKGEGRGDGEDERGYRNPCLSQPV